MNIPESIPYIVLVGLSAILWLDLRAARRARREQHIREFTLPPGLFDKLRQHHPHLTQKDCQLVAQGLRQFFMAHLKSGRQFVSMPSQVVDDLWHEFILYTREYNKFCRQAFGRFLHHSPAIMLLKGQRNNAGIRRTWHYACHEENINPKNPTRLPLLFALDAKFSIPNGYVYVPDCSGFPRQDGSSSAAPYCGGDLGHTSSGCGGGSDGGADWGDGGGHSSDGGGDSGGSDGGGGCGGGGCGGGGGD